MQIVFLLGLTITSLVASIHARAPELTADEPIVLSPDGKQLIAQGNAELEHDKFFLQADNIRYSKDGGFGQASGNVSLGLEKSRIVTEEATYNLEERSIKTGELQATIAPWCFQSASFKADGEQTLFEKPMIAFGSPDAFVPNVTAQSAIWNPQERSLTLNHSLLKIGAVPFFYWPSLKIRPNQSPFHADFKVSYRKSLGGVFKTKFSLPIAIGLEPGVNVAYFSRRGVLAGPTLSTDFSNAHISAKGDLTTGFIRDRGDRGTDILKRPIGKKRDYISWRQKIKAKDHLEVTAKIDAWSDSYVTRDFDSKLYARNQEPDNFAEVFWNDERYQLDLITRFNPNNFQSYTERLPEVRFNWTPSKLGVTPIYHQFQASFAHLRRKTLEFKEETSANRALMYYGIFCPIKVTPWSTFTPIAGVQLSQYSAIYFPKAPKKNYTRWIPQIGFDWEMHAHGLWGNANSAWKHTVKPIIQYRYLIDAHKGSNIIPHLDDAPFEPYLPVLDLAERRDIDHMDETHNLRFGIENTLDRKTPQQNRTVANLNFYQDLRFERQFGQRKWSDFYTELIVSPIKSLSFRLFNRTDPQSLTSKQTDLSLKIQSATHWQFRVGLTHLPHDTQQYWTGFSIALNEAHRLSLALRYDARLHKLIEQWYGYEFHLGNSWRFEPYLKRFVNASREKGWEVGLRMALVQF